MHTNHFFKVNLDGLKCLLREKKALDHTWRIKIVLLKLFRLCWVFQSHFLFRYALCPNFIIGVPLQPRMAFFGIFDGHLGRCAAEFTKANLPYNIFRHASFDANTLSGGDVVHVKEAIKGGYLKTDSDFLAVAEKDGLKSGNSFNSFSCWSILIAKQEQRL